MAWTRRKFGAAMASVLAAAWPAGAPAPAEALPDGDPSVDGIEQDLFAAVNGERTERGLAPLEPLPALAHAAADHSADMARHHFFDHDSSNGQSMGRRVRRYAARERVGEVLAWVNRRKVEREVRWVIRGWLDSPSHRRVMLSERYRYGGVGRETGRHRGVPAAFFTLNLATTE